MSRLFVSATGQHAGKTTLSLGLYQLLRAQHRTVNFMKPVGQRQVVSKDGWADEDVLLFRQLGCKLPFQAMSPVAIPKGFTEDYIFHRNKAKIYDQIDRAILEIDRNTEMVIIEGTGHAGVGSVIDASNAVVARLMGAKAVIIAEGGVGRAIDQICLNHALFRYEEVEVQGVIVNKVLPEKYDKVNRVVRMGLKNLGIECLGVIPYDQELVSPSIRQYIDELSLTIFNTPINGSESFLDKRVHNIVVATMPANKVQNFIKKNSLLIVSEGNIDVLDHLLQNIKESSNNGLLTGVLVTDDFRLTEQTIKSLDDLQVAALGTNKDAFTISKILGKLVVKIGPNDKDKVHKAYELISKYVDTDLLLKAFE